MEILLQLAWDIDNGKGWIHLIIIGIVPMQLMEIISRNKWIIYFYEWAQNLQVYATTSTDVHTINFGQDSTFHGQVSAGGNADANGVGDFIMHLQLIFLRVVQKSSRHNIKSKSIRTGNDHFNTVLYTGDGNATQNITGVGFMPDWTWIKKKCIIWSCSC